MKVLFHCWEFPPNGTGVGAYIQQMSRALTSTGHACVIVTGRAEGLPEREDTECGTVYRVYDRSELRSEAVVERVLNIAGEHRVDLIEGADHLGECASIMRRPHRPRVMIKLHSSNAVDVLTRSQIFYPWQHLTVRLALWRCAAQIAAERQSILGADFACVPSRRLREELVRQGIPRAESFEVIPNPVTAVAESGAAESAGPTLLFVGRIDIGKGIEYLPTIMEAVWRRVPDCVLEIAGHDGYARGLGSMKAWLSPRFFGGLKQVRFLGPLGPRELDVAYRRAWAVVVPSRWDNFPGAVLEAMIRGRPVVASPHGGMPEMLEGTRCPVADPARPAFAEAVVRLLTDPQERKAAGEAARQKARTAYSPDVIVKQYVEFVSTRVR